MRKTSILLNADKAVLSYICDRERAVVWGIKGGLPSMPHGLHMVRAGKTHEDWLGSVFSDLPMKTGDVFSRPTAGGGGYGDPLERDPAAVLEDVIDDYVSVERAAKDYGVVIRPVDPEMLAYEIDEAETAKARASIRASRREWAEADPEQVAADYKAGKIDRLDAVRRYAVILDWESGEVLPKSTEQFREMFRIRTVAGWA